MTIDLMRMGDGFQIQLDCGHEVTGGEMKCKRCGKTLEFKPQITVSESSTIDWKEENKKNQGV